MTTTSTLHFTVVDFVLFGIMLAISLAIGLYFACTGGKQKTTGEFLLADRKMGWFPVSLSLMACFMSAITLLGVPAEIYSFGTQYWFMCLSYLIMIPLSVYVYLPVFYHLKVTSAYEYLKMRFSKSVQVLASATFILQMTLYMSLVLYAPSLALNAVTGINLWMIVAAVGLVGTVYTAVGGMKAVMWTDVFQALLMYAAMIAIVVKGSVDAGGLDEVWRVATERGRIQFDNISPDPRIRHTLWSLLIGGAFTSTAIYGVNQAMVQRCCSCTSLRVAQISLWLNLPILWLLMSLCALAGLVIFAAYRDCDPLSAGSISRPDQLVPLFVLQHLSFFRGLPGLFLAGLVSGTLSTISSGLNSLAAVTLRDLILPNRALSEHRSSIVSRLLAVGYGLLCMGLAYLASHMGFILQAALSLFGVLGGPLLGVFSLGMLVPWANWKGALAGHLTALVLLIVIMTGAIVRSLPLYRPPVSTLGCSETLLNGSTNGNATFGMSPVTTTIAASSSFDPPSGLDGLYSLSYLHYATLAVFTVLIIGAVVSWFTGIEDSGQLDARLMSPLFHVINKRMPLSLKTQLKQEIVTNGEEVKSLNGGSSELKLNGRNSRLSSNVLIRQQESFRLHDCEATECTKM